MSQSLALQLGKLDELAQLPLLSLVRFVGNARLGRERDVAGAEIAKGTRASNKGTVWTMIIMNE